MTTVMHQARAVVLPAREAVEDAVSVRAPRSARSKIIRLVVVTVATLTLLIALSAAGFVLLQQRVSRIADEVLPQSTANTAVRTTLTEMQTSLRGYLLTGEDKVLDPYRAADAGLDDDFRTLAGLTAGDPTLAPLVAAQQQAAMQWRDDYATKIADGRITATDRVQLLAAQDSFTAFVDSNDTLTTTINARAASVASQSRLLAEIALAVMIIIGVGGKAMVIRPGLRALRYIGPPLEALHGTVRRLRTGDLTARADPTQGVVEIRTVAAAVNELADVNQRQRDHLAEELRLSAAVRTISLVINQSLDLGDVIDHSVRPIYDQFRVSSAWIRCWEGRGELPGRGRRVTYPPESGLFSPDVLVLCARRMAYLGWQRQTYGIVSRDHPRDDDFLSAEEHTALLDHIGTVGRTSLVIVPIGSGLECLGYLALGRSADEPDWSTAETTALLQVGRDLGRAIQHARIFEREQQLVGELQSLDVKKRDFVSMVSHELRTPLASIIGHLEIIRSGDLGYVPEDMESSLLAMDRNSLRLTRLIEDLLLISRIEEGVQPTKLRPVDLCHLSQEVVHLHTDAAQRRGIRLVVDGITAAPALGDPDELERVISNLVGNAIKFSPAQSTVEVAVRSGSEGSSVTVIDHGMGISTVDQEQLFTRFFRSSNPVAHAVPGTGLGLTISKLIVDKHRGSIRVSSEVGQGSSFTVQLPAVDLLIASTHGSEPAAHPATDRQPVLTDRQPR